MKNMFLNIYNLRTDDQSQREMEEEVYDAYIWRIYFKGTSSVMVYFTFLVVL